MISSLLQAITTSDSRTENGAITNSTSSSALVDLFFQIGALRKQVLANDVTNIMSRFLPALNEDARKAMQILFWSRDILQGAGERGFFKIIIKEMVSTDFNRDILKKNLHLIPSLGRWDDLFVLLNTPLQDNVIQLIKEGLENNDGLLAKWLPRRGLKEAIIRKALGMSAKDYRKKIVNLSKTVEQKMASREFSLINYNQVPSKAMKKYYKAFFKHDKERFQDYLNKLKSGDKNTKINVKTLHPHEIVAPVLRKNNYNDQLVEAQWKALPNYMEGNSERIIPLIDVSGSMTGSKIESPINVAVSLGMYIAERNEGIFKDAFITFSESPKLEIIQGDSIINRIKSIENSKWGNNTNIIAVFDLILNNALKHKITEDEMPTMLLVLSDMEFDSAFPSTYINVRENVGSDGGFSSSKTVEIKVDATTFEIIRTKFEVAGYKMPKIAFWNIESRNKDNVPVKMNENNVALISGFSPSIMKSLLGGKSFTPYDIMMETISKERYSTIEV